MKNTVYTMEEYRTLIPRIPYCWMREYLGDLLKEERLYTIEVYLKTLATPNKYLYLTTYEKLPLMINDTPTEFGRVLIKWRLGIGK